DRGIAVKAQTQRSARLLVQGFIGGPESMSRTCVTAGPNAPVDQHKLYHTRPWWRGNVMRLELKKKCGRAKRRNGKDRIVGGLTTQPCFGMRVAGRRLVWWWLDATAGRWSQPALTCVIVAGCSNVLSSQRTPS